MTNLRFGIQTDDNNALRLLFDADFIVFKSGDWALRSAYCGRVDVVGESLHLQFSTVPPQQNVAWSLWLCERWNTPDDPMVCPCGPDGQVIWSRTERLEDLITEAYRKETAPDHGGDADRVLDTLKTVGSFG